MFSDLFRDKMTLYALLLCEFLSLLAARLLLLVGLYQAFVRFCGLAR